MSGYGLGAVGKPDTAGEPVGTGGTGGGYGVTQVLVVLTWTKDKGERECRNGNTFCLTEVTGEGINADPTPTP